MYPNSANGNDTNDNSNNKRAVVVGVEREIGGLMLGEYQDAGEDFMLGEYLDAEEDLNEEEEEEEEGELSSLLPIRSRTTTINRNNQPKASTKRKVQWNDKNGKKLVEVLEFQPSDSSDSDDDDDSDSCFCIIM